MKARFERLYADNTNITETEVFEISSFLSKRNFFSQTFAKSLNYFLTEEFQNLEQSSDGLRTLELSETKDALIDLLKLFVKRKIPDKFYSFILDFSPIYSELSFERLQKLILYYPLNHIVIGIPSLEMPDLALKFLQEFYFKKQFFFMERLCASEITHLSPIYRFKARQKNRLFFEEEFTKTFQVKDFLKFIKDSLDKFIPNASELWHLESSVPHLTIFKILKTLFEFSVFTKEEMMEIVILLQDKAGVLRNLEKLVDAEQNVIHKSISMDTTTTTMQEIDKIPFNKIEIELWVRSLMKIRQYYAEIFILGFIGIMDEQLVTILINNRNLVENFHFSEGRELSDEDRHHIRNLERQVKYENLQIFNEDVGPVMMRAFFRYILVSSQTSTIQITAKTKNIAKIFLSFFSNIHDLNLSALVAMNTESFRFLTEIPNFLDRECPKKPEITAPLTEFTRICIEKYLLDTDANTPLSDFMINFLNMRKLIGDISTSEVQLGLFMKGFLWVFLQTMRKYSSELCKPENNENKEKLIGFLREIIPNNVFFMSKSLQSRFLQLVSPEKAENSVIYVSVIGILFEKFPNLIVTNLTYLKFIFDLLAQIPRKTDEDYEKAANLLNFLRYFLKKSLYSTMRFLPHYDLLCLEQMLSHTMDFGQKEVFNNIELLLTTRSVSPSKHQFFLRILQILCSATKTRFTKLAHASLCTRFETNTIIDLFRKLSLDQNLIQNLKIHKVLLSLLRNLHIQASESIFDDKETRITFKKKKKGSQKKADSLADIEKRFSLVKTTSEEADEEGKVMEEIHKEKKKRKGTSEPIKHGDEESESGEIWGVLHGELEMILGCLKKGAILTDRDKKKLKNYFYDVVECICKKTKKEILENIQYGRVHHFEYLKMGQHEKRKRDKIEELSRLLKDNIAKMQEAFLIKEFKKRNFEFELEVQGITGPFVRLLINYKEIEARCEFYCDEIKLKKKTFSAGEMMKRFSNKLEDRQKSVWSPYEQAKDSLRLNPANKIGKLYAALYESFKLKKLSTWSSIKKSEQNESNENIYMKILKESKEKKDGISVNFIHFIHSELFDTASEFQNLRPETHLKSTMSLLEIMENNNEENKVFQMKNRNYKYILIDFLSNVLFHATRTCQSEIFKLVSQDLKVLDIIWDEIIFNISYVYNNSHQGKHWKEAFMYSINLIKTLQYFCEDNNFEFKKWIKEGFVLKSEEEMSKFEQIKEILTRFFYRNDWGKKNWHIMKRKSLFPIAQALFDFLGEIMSGPCVEIQEILTREVFDFRMIGNLLNTFDERSWEMIQEKKIDLNKKDDSRTIVQINEFSELKSSIVDCLLVCCEGANDVVMDNQYKKFNQYEILDTIVNLGKLLCWRIAKNEPFGCLYSLINYWTYFKLKKNFKKANFNEFEQDTLDIALKLFIYLQNLSEQSFTLKHILESKAILAKKNIMKHSLKKINFFSCQKDILPVASDKNNDDRSSDLTMGFVIKFLSKKAGKLEIIDKDESPEAESSSKFIYFKSTNDFDLLSQETRDTFINSVDRTSHETKIHNLIVSCSYFDKEINIRRELIKSHPNLVMRFSNFKRLEIFLFLICVIINILMLLYYQNETTDYLYYTIIVFGLIEFIFSVFILIIWMIIRFPVEISINSLKYCEQKGLKSDQITKQTFLRLIIETIMDEDFVRVLILHIICTTLGLTLCNGFYAIDIFSIISLSATFKYLAKSISSHGQQLMFTFIMVAIFIYVFSVFADIFFRDNFNNDLRQCTTLINCFWSILNTGFTNGSGIGGILSPEMLKEGNEGRYFGYILIDLLFFICVNCILLNIVFGIIVDTFGELREESEKFGTKFKEIYQKIFS